MIDDKPKNVAFLRDAEDEGIGEASSSSAATEKSQYRAPIHHSKLRRKFGHDYASPFAYLITIETTDRRRLLGTLVGNSAETALIEPTELGQNVIAYFRNIERYVKEKTGCYVQVLQYQLMPEHFHGILQIHDTLPKGWTLGKIIRGWKSVCSQAYWSSSSPVAPSSSSSAATKKSQSNSPLFTPGYNDRPLLSKGQLDGWIAYLRDNPRRRWLKQHFPDRLRKVYDFAAGESKTRYTAVGDTFMIKYPDRQQVRCHRNLTSEQIQAEVDYYLSLARSGVVLVSPFISPAEKAVYEACYKEKRRMIRLVKRALDGKFVYPQGRDFDACVQGFLLVLSPFPTGNENAAETTITRNQCLSLNDYAADLASSPARRVNDAYHGYIPSSPVAPSSSSPAAPSSSSPAAPSSSSPAAPSSSSSAAPSSSSSAAPSSSSPAAPSSSSPAAPSSSSPAATKKSQSPIYTPPAPSR